MPLILAVMPSAAAFFISASLTTFAWLATATGCQPQRVLAMDAPQPMLRQQQRQHSDAGADAHHLVTQQQQHYPGCQQQAAGGADTHLLAADGSSSRRAHDSVCSI